jgi:hypothetical protein
MKSHLCKLFNFHFNILVANKRGSQNVIINVDNHNQNSVRLKNRLLLEELANSYKKGDGLTYIFILYCIICGRRD